MNISNLTSTKILLLAAALQLGFIASCADNNDFASNNQQVRKTDPNKLRGKNPYDPNDPNNPNNVPNPNPNGNPNSRDPDPNNTLTTDSGGKVLLLNDIFNGAVEYQGNQCPNGGACGDENVQMAIDGLDFRDIDQTTTLQPATAKEPIRKYVGKTVMTGIGSGALWGARKATFKASNVTIYFRDDVIQANTCPSDRVPIGKPKVARTSQMGLFLCAKLDSRISLGPTVNIPAGNWTYGVHAECPAGHIVMGGVFNGINQPWQIQCAPMQVKKP